MRAPVSGRLAASLAGAAVVAALLIMDASAHDLMAQAPRNPFDLGVREGAGPPPQTGLAAWILQQQIRFERMLSGAVRAIATDATAFWTLLGISFAYGVFHAAGPGHGKAVVASYALANERSLKRGVAISLMAALVQGLVAIAIVGVLAALLNATSARMKRAANLVELASYAGVAALGLWLMWRKGRGLIAALGLAGSAHAAHAHDHGHTHAACGHDHSHDPHHAHGRTGHDHHHDPVPVAKAAHTQPHAHVHGPDCGHFHAPAPETLGDGFSWKTAALTVFAAGARPCSGAILVLVFSLAQGIFLAGVAATFAMSMGTAITTSALAAIAVLAKGLATRFLGEGSGRGGVIGVRALEFVAAILVFLLGATLVTGAWARGLGVLT